MAAPELNCPNCGAPLKVESGISATTTCPFCDTVVLLPPELHPAPVVDIQVVNYSSPAAEAIPAAPRAAPRKGFIFLWLGLLLLIGFAIPTVISRYQQANLAEELQFNQTATQNALAYTQTAAPSPTPLPSLTPTPQYAEPVLTFGQAGIGEGMFNRAGYIAADGQGNLYVADYDGGRIQRFDADGRYLSQWRVGNSKTFIHGMSASYNGNVFVAYDQVIDQFDGASGKRLNQLVYPEGGEFGDLAVTADGNLAAVWYEGRWGLIMGLEGHREELVEFNADGEIIRQLPNFISAQTEDLALDVDLVVDGAGKIYALSDGVIFEYSPEGRFLDRITTLGGQSGQFISSNTFAIDGQGRLYIVDGRDVSVYDADQRFVDHFTSPAYLNSLAIDRSGGIWGASDEQVIHFALR